MMDMEGIERGCGVREPGGIYAEVPLSPFGSPIWKFLCDPPLSLGDLSLPPRGVQIMERPGKPGLFDVWDWVGEGSYPNVADMVEEIKRFGVSRRLGKSLDFSLLGPGSLLILVHPRAILRNAGMLYRAIHHEALESPGSVAPWHCPCDVRGHNDLLAASWEKNIGDEELDMPTCAGLWWETLTKADPIYDLSAPRRSCTRTSGSTHYEARHAPHGFKPDWEPGIFARFPLHRIAVVSDPEGGQDQVALDRLRDCRLPVREVDF